MATISQLSLPDKKHPIGSGIACIGYLGNIYMFNIFCIVFSMDPLRSEIKLYYYYYIIAVNHGELTAIDSDGNMWTHSTL